MAQWLEHSLGIAPQFTAFGTPNNTDGDYKYIQADAPKIQFATEIVEQDLMTGQIGAAPRRLVGRRSGSLSFSMPLEGLKEGYDPIVEDPGSTGVLPMWMNLVGNALGSYAAGIVSAATFWKGDGLSVSQYTADGMESGTASSIVTTAPASAKIHGGQLTIAALSPTSTVPQIGWVKTKVVNTLTLFEAAANNVNNTLAEMFGTGNAWLSNAHANQIPMTMRYVGENTEACYVLQDCICESFKITWESGAVPTVEFSFKFYDFSMDKTKGGLQIPASFQTIPQIVGTNNGRAMLGASLQCGLSACVVEYKCEILERKCHSATQGIDGVTYRKPRITVGCVIPYNNADVVYDSAGGAGNTGSHKWQSFLERGVSSSLGVYVGSNVGRIFSFLVPKAIFVAVPQLSIVDGAESYTLAIEAGAYSADSSDIGGDTATTCPIDSLFRVAVG